MTRGELATEAGIELGMVATAGTEDGDRLRIWIQEGVDNVLLDTQVYADVQDITLTVGVTKYRLPSTILAVLSSEIRGDTNTSLRLVDYETLQEKLRANAVEGAFYAALLGHDWLVVAPSPSAGQVIRIDYVPRPTRMTADGNDPSSSTYGGIPDWGHEAILAWVRFKAAIRNDKLQGLNVENARALYDLECGKIRKRMRRKAGRRTAPARIGYPGRNTGRRNDVYYSGA